MVRMIVIAAICACSQKSADDKGATPGKSGAMGASGDMGSAMGTTPMDATTPPSIDAPAMKTPDEIAKRYEECVALGNGARWDELRNCYAATATFEMPGLGEPPRDLDKEIEETKRARAAVPDYKQEPQLVMISGSTVIAIVLVTATSPKKKPLGIYVGNVIAIDPQGKAIRDLAFFDAKTLEAQMQAKAGVRAVAKAFPTKIAVISKNDDQESSNLDIFKHMHEAEQKRDLAAFGSFIADDVVWSVQNRPKDLTKAEILAGIKQRIEKTDLAYKIDAAWAAGEYVASLETVSGTATADAPDKKIKRGDKIERQLLAVHRFVNGKLAQVWVFAQG